MSDAYDSLVRAAEARSKRLDDPCKHITRCADAACGYRMEAAEDAAVTADQSRPVPRASEVHVHDWVPIEWGEPPDYEPLAWRCRVCGELEASA